MIYALMAVVFAEDRWSEAMPSAVNPSVAASQLEHMVRVHQTYANLEIGLAHDDEAIAAWGLYEAALKDPTRGSLRGAAELFAMYLVTSYAALDRAERAYRDVVEQAAALDREHPGGGEAARRAAAEQAISAIERDQRAVAARCAVEPVACAVDRDLEARLAKEITTLKEKMAADVEGRTAWDVERMARLLMVRAVMRRLDLEERAEGLLMKVTDREITDRIRKTL